MSPIEIALERHAARARNVSGDRVDRFYLAAKARLSARVQKIDRRRAVDDVRDRDDARQRRSDPETSPPVDVSIAPRTGSPSACQAGESAVQALLTRARGRASEAATRRARRVGAVGGVVGDDLGLRADAPSGRTLQRARAGRATGAEPLTPGTTGPERSVARSANTGARHVSCLVGAPIPARQRQSSDARQSSMHQPGSSRCSNRTFGSISVSYIALFHR